MTPGSSSGAETILVVDDQEEIRKVVGRMLRARGFHVLLAANGHEALRLGSEVEALRRVDDQAREIDLLVTDVAMPGMSGLEVALLLAPAHPKMKVLYLSGYTDEVIVDQSGLAAGINFLQKPFTADGLVGKVREVLDAPRDA